MEAAIILTIVLSTTVAVLALIGYSVKKVSKPHILALTEQIDRIGGRDIWIQRDYKKTGSNALWFDVVFTDTSGQRLPNRAVVYKDAHSKAVSDYIWLAPLKSNDIETVRDRLLTQDRAADTQFAM